MAERKGVLVMHKEEKSGEIYVSHLGSNGRILNHTESFTQKPSAWTNIISTTADFGPSAEVYVQDNSLVGEPIVYIVNGKGKVTATELPPRKLNLGNVKLKSRSSALKGKTVKAKKVAAPKKAKKVAKAAPVSSTTLTPRGKW